jgi:hypothetical protein
MVLRESENPEKIALKVETSQVLHSLRLSFSCRSPYMYVVYLLCEEKRTRANPFRLASKQHSEKACHIWILKLCKSRKAATGVSIKLLVFEGIHWKQAMSKHLKVRECVSYG